MPLHPLDRSVGSDLSFQVLQLRRRRQELGSQALDSTNQTLHPVVTRPSCFDGFIGDPELSQPDTDIVPTWHYRGKRKG